VLFGLGGVALAWMVVRTSTSYALVDLNPYAVSKVAPDDPRVALNIALIEFALNNGKLTDRRRERTYAAMTKAPLAETPMLVAAVSALAAGDSRKGEALLLEARHRDPRFILARLLLLDQYLKTARIGEAGQEIAVLTRLLPEAGNLLVPELAKMATKPGSGVALMRALRRDPQLQQDVLARLAATEEPAMMLRLAAEAAPSGNAPNWQAVLLKRLVDKGDFAQAHAMWRNFAHLPPAGAEKSVYDGRFANLPGAAPFNWQLTASAAGVAERLSGGGLQVQYFGRDPAELGSQILLLRPGNYRLRIEADGDASGEGAKLAWTLVCGTGGAKLAELPMLKISSAPKWLEARFSIPQAGCASQSLRLSGSPAEFPTEQDATIREVRVERIGA
jgi:hypothetical protein